MTAAQLNQFFHTGRLNALTIMYEARNIGRTDNDTWKRYSELSQWEKNKYFAVWWDAKKHIKAIPYQITFDFMCDYCDNPATGTWNNIRLCNACALEVC